MQLNEKWSFEGAERPKFNLRLRVRAAIRETGWPAMRTTKLARLSGCAAIFALIGAAPALGATMGPSQAELDRSALAADSWLMTNKSYDGWRRSALNQVNAGNVANLKEACAYDSGLPAQAQSTPLLYGGRIYFTAAQTTIAIDARTCKEIWRHEWKLKGKALSTVNRGPAIKDGKLIRGTADGYLIALSMEDGKPVWERQITSIEESHYLSMPPLIVDDMIIYGTAGADWGGQGWIGAFSLRDGAEIWRYGVLPAPDAPGRKAGARRKPSPMAAEVSGRRCRLIA